MFVSYFEISISVIVRIIRAFCLPGGLIQFFSAWGTEKIAGLWFARGADEYPGWHYDKLWEHAYEC